MSYGCGLGVIIVEYLAMLVPLRWFNSVKIKEMPLDNDCDKLSAYSRSLRKTKSVFRKELKHKY